MAVLQAPPEAAAPFPEPGPARLLGRHGVVLVAAGTLLLALAMGSLWAWRTFASSEGFADAVTDMLKDEAVRDIVADTIVSNLSVNELTADLALNTRPVLEQAVDLVIGTDTFHGLFHVAVEEVHATIVRGARESFVVEVPDAAKILGETLSQVSPTLTSLVPDDAVDAWVSVSQNVPLDTAIRVASVAGWLALPFALGALVCLLAAVLSAPDRRRAVEVVGWCLVGLGGFTWALLHVLGGLASRAGATDLEGRAIRAVFWSATNLLSIQSTIAITGGAVMVVAGAYAGTTNLRTRGHLLWEALWQRLERPGWKALASILLLVVAAAAMVWPAGAAAVTMRGVAFVAFVAGAVAMLDLIGSRHWTDATFGPIPVSTRRVALGSFGVVMATCALVFFGGTAFVAAVRAPAAKHGPISETGCNDDPTLCDKRLDQVTLAGTHNSMAAGSEGWVMGYSQERGILGQLAAGVRVLLVDMHYGYRVNRLVRTDLSRQTTKGLDDRAYTAEEQAFLDRTLGMVGSRTAESEVHLCHLECALGATPAVDAFEDVDGFLREAPNNVLLIIVQDEVEAADAIEVFEDSGLARRAYVWKPGTPMPTLREMIERRRNVLIMAENEGGTVVDEPWYHAAYGPSGLLEETPFHFTSPEDFSCEANRGRNGALFLLNHWLEGSNAVEAREVNDQSVLRRRIRQCERERGRPVNIVAVDHHEQGDLFEVVRRFNHD
jgi:hypothetical protein